MTIPKIGDTVAFHYRTQSGTPLRNKPAVILQVYPPPPARLESADLEVDFSEEEVAATGFQRIQRHKVFVVGRRPQSGEWTQPFKL